MALHQALPAVVRCLVVVAPLLAFVVPSARAEGDLAAASAAFRQGQALQLTGNHDGAADAFLLADSISPTPEALRSAINNLAFAKRVVRAATLALEARRRYPQDAVTERTVERVLSEASQLLRVQVSCSEPCTVSVPGSAVFSEPRAEVAFFLEPKPIDLEIRFSSGVLNEHIVGKPGELVSLRFVAPLAAPSSDSTSAPSQRVRPASLTESDSSYRSRARLSPAYFWSGVSVTALLGGATVWAGLSTLRRNDRYEQAPTKAKHHLAANRQKLTNGLIGLTAASALTTSILAIFTRWRGVERDRRANVTVYADAVSAHVTVSAPLRCSW